MATTPNRRDAYMGAMKKPEKKSLGLSQSKSKPQPPAKGPQFVMGYRESGMSGGTLASKLAPETSKRPKPSPINTSKLAPTSSPRTVPNPKKKQKPYPGTKKMNYGA